jgi:hypothetical protein
MANRHPMTPHGHLEALSWPLALTTWRIGQEEAENRVNLALGATWWRNRAKRERG